MRRVVVKLLCCGSMHAMQWGPQELWGPVGDRLSAGTWCTSMSEHVKPGGRHCGPGLCTPEAAQVSAQSHLPSVVPYWTPTQLGFVFDQSRFVWCQLRTWSCLLGGGWGGVCHHPLGSSISQMMAGCTESLDFVGDALFFPKGRNVFRDLCFRWDVESGLLAWQRSNGLLSKHKQQFILELRLLWNDSGCWTQTLFRYFKNKQTEAGWNWILPCQVLSCLHGIDSICEGFVLGATKRTCIG